jgi:purine-nucleoside phosphorylase
MNSTQGLIPLPSLPASANRQVVDAASHIHKVINNSVDVFMVAGSGFRDALPNLVESIIINMSDVPNLPGPKVAGHGGQLIYGRYKNKCQVLIATGRVHLYENYSPDEVVFGVRMAAALGAKAVVLTNASGSVDPQIPAGSLVLIQDQINLSGRNCGFRDDGGVTFTDMDNAYDQAWRTDFLATGKVRECVYASVSGPTYETRAEARMLGLMGANIVGMSTVLECIAARMLGIKVLGISLVTNMAGGIGGAIDHGEVLSTAKNQAANISSMLDRALATS